MKVFLHWFFKILMINYVFHNETLVWSRVRLSLLILLIDTNRVVWGFQDSVGEWKWEESGVADSAPSVSLEHFNGFLCGCYMNKGISCITLKSCLFCKSEDVYSHRWLCSVSVLANQVPPFSEKCFWAVCVCLCETLTSPDRYAKVDPVPKTPPALANM